MEPGATESNIRHFAKTIDGVATRARALAAVDAAERLIKQAASLLGAAGHYDLISFPTFPDIELAAIAKANGHEFDVPVRVNALLLRLDDAGIPRDVICEIAVRAELIEAGTVDERRRARDKLRKRLADAREQDENSFEAARKRVASHEFGKLLMHHAETGEGKIPTPESVFAAYEEKLRRQMTDDGVDIDEVLSASPVLKSV